MNSNLCVGKVGSECTNSTDCTYHLTRSIQMNKRYLTIIRGRGKDPLLRMRLFATYGIVV